jgi:hypothetical protein
LVQTELLEMKAVMIYEQEVAEEMYPNAGIAKQQWKLSSSSSPNVDCSNASISAWL